MFRTVIVGAGIAGVQTALELRSDGYDGELVLISEEHHEPYDRPPLSKEFLKGTAELDSIGLLTGRIARDRQIDLRLGMKVTHLDRRAHTIELSDGSTVAYDRAVLATGAQNRELPVVGSGAAGVWSLRNLDEAVGLREALGAAKRAVIVGGGFIGLEVAAAASLKGADVTVVEFMPRVMARVLSPEMSQHFADQHAAHGVVIRPGTGVTEILSDADNAVTGVVLSDGSTLPADVVVIGVGVAACTDLAAQAGLAVDNGIVVDGKLRTSDRSVYAIGDCAQFDCVVSGGRLRLESIQNAVDQARFVAREIAAEASDEPAPVEATYEAIPWFWTEQFASKLQIAGVALAEADSVVRGDPASGSFSVCRFVGDRLVCVESVNQARDHIAARKILAADPGRLTRLTREAVADATVALKSLIDA